MMHRQETVECLKKFNARRKLKVGRTQSPSLHPGGPHAGSRGVSGTCRRGRRRTPNPCLFTSPDQKIVDAGTARRVELGRAPASASWGLKEYGPRAKKKGPSGPSRLGRQVDKADPDSCWPVKDRVRPGNHCFLEFPQSPEDSPDCPGPVRVVLNLWVETPLWVTYQVVLRVIHNITVAKLQL